MSIDAKLAELERRRDALLREMDENTTHLGEYMREWYSPVNILRRHVCSAMGIAAALGTLTAAAKLPRASLLRLIWTRLLHHKDNNSGGNPPSDPSGAVASSTDSTPTTHSTTESHETRHRGFGDVAERLVANIVLDAAQAVPWGSLLNRVRLKLQHRDGQTDQKGPSGH